MHGLSDDDFTPRGYQEKIRQAFGLLSTLLILAKEEGEEHVLLEADKGEERISIVVAGGDSARRLAEEYGIGRGEYEIRAEP